MNKSKKKIKQDLALTSNYKAELRNWNFVKSHKLNILRKFCWQGPNFKHKFIAILWKNSTKVNYKVLHIFVLQYATVLFEISAVITK